MNTTPTFSQTALSDLTRFRISRSEALDAVAAGSRHRRGGQTLYVSGDVRVLLNADTGRVITVWRGARHDGPWRRAVQHQRKQRARRCPARHSRSAA